MVDCATIMDDGLTKSDAYKYLQYFNFSNYFNNIHTVVIVPI